MSRGTRRVFLRRRQRVLVALGVALGVTSCKGDTRDSPVPSTRAPSLEDELGAHLEAVATCRTNARGELDMACPSAEYFDRWSRTHFEILEKDAASFVAVAAPLADHEAPATRSVVVRLAGLGLEKGDAPSGALLWDRIAIEVDPGVGRQIVHVAARSQKRTPIARGIVAAGLTHRDAAVREVACLLLDVEEDVAALDALDRLLDQTTEPALFQVCFQALASAWTTRSPRSRGAYERTMKRLETGPRDANHPVFPVVFELTTLAHGNGLLEKARLDRLVRAIAKDPAASPATRSAALTSLMEADVDLQKEIGLTVAEAHAIIQAGIAETTARPKVPL
jgi:hypothetical protein